MTSFDQRKWIAKLRTGDAQAHRLLYDLYADRVAGFLYRLASDRSESEDLVQEVFVAAYTGRCSYGGRAQPLAWLLGIASRKWRDRNRRASLPLADMNDEHFADTLATPRQRSVEDQVIDTDSLDRALSHLEPAFREALLLVASQGLTYQEAAVVTDEPVGTVKWRVWEATRRVRAILESNLEEVDGLRKTDAATSVPTRNK